MATAAVLALVLAGCASERGRSVVDGVGRRVELPPAVERIVTLAPNVTELVAAAGGAGRIVGTDDASDFPPSIRPLPTVGEMQPSLEAIVTLDPDLVIASTAGNPPSLGPALAALRIPLFVLKTDRLEDLGPALRQLGEVLGTDPAEAIESLETGLARGRRSRSPRPRVLVLLWPEPLYVAGVGTYVDDLIGLAGGRNAVRVGGWPAYSLEALVASPPDLILVPGESVGPDLMRRLVAESEAWKAVPAASEGRIHPFPDDLVLRPGPRVTEGLREINEILDSWERAR
ncbi:MAG TPA: helical backbone metal receptor [Thermoanaerobaculia bacterium]|nr:helical backbone metal receptor [Thermoanaerobaculia bacterium]